MKAAVTHLEQFMEKADARTRGKIILATVKGDVHDIGKNLVEIILSNNGYTVVNLGIKVPPEDADPGGRASTSPTSIGLSGLLVKSAQQMVITAEDLKTAGIDLPMLVGGAALTTQVHLHADPPGLRELVGYAKDAMQGLDLANQVMSKDGRAALDKKIADEALRFSAEDTAAPAVGVPVSTTRSTRVRADEPTLAPPDLERHLAAVPDLRALWPYVNRQFLFAKHLGIKGAVDRLAEAKDAKYLELSEIVADVQRRCEAGWLKARAVYRCFKANSRRQHAASSTTRKGRSWSASTSPASRVPTASAWPTSSVPRSSASTTSRSSR